MNEIDATLRPAQSGDAARLSLIGQATFLESFADVLPGSDVIKHCLEQHSRADYEARLSGEGHALWLAELPKGAPIGYAALSPPDLPTVEAQAGDVELKRIYVLSRFHGTGVARSLMAASLRQAREWGCGRLLLGVYGRNGRAIRFYQKNDFAIIGARKFQVGENVYDDVIMGRDL
ncbi:GNAT family N-acetyltransferase [Pacificimonas flava]|uniref:GNAT family N-acetyltransferase n=2 Tax=Pacificimonas TaxID=1960290 RepID=A0A219B222_9SPHN|nr:MULTISPECIES: GNAT family N-acetyltransferase [Pacificimonas]MBZ6377989.1 GNAT family N-acetyltransferase [Pacificimonas aurantium]OWV32365.1 GNAT family N-acetyltransferase [Pacificimonas flava]